MIAHASRTAPLEPSRRRAVLRLMSRAAMLSDGLGLAGGLRAQPARVIHVQGLVAAEHALKTATELAKVEASKTP
jgi:hypothetical protein